MFIFDDLLKMIMGVRGNGNFVCFFLIIKLCIIYVDKFYIMVDLCF